MLEPQILLKLDIFQFLRVVFMCKTWPTAGHVKDSEDKLVWLIICLIRIKHSKTLSKKEERKKGVVQLISWILALSFSQNIEIVLK